MYDSANFASAQAQWNSYSPGEQAALEVKYYAVGQDGIAEKNAGYEQYNLDGYGSDAVVYYKNLQTLEVALRYQSPAGQLELQLTQSSVSGGYGDSALY